MGFKRRVYMCIINKCIYTRSVSVAPVISESANSHGKNEKKKRYFIIIASERGLNGSLRRWSADPVWQINYINTKYRVRPRE